MNIQNLFRMSNDFTLNFTRTFQVISIPSTDESYCSFCTYYISVTAAYGESAYSLAATTHADGGFVVLIDGQPISDSLLAMNSAG